MPYGRSARKGRERIPQSGDGSNVDDEAEMCAVAGRDAREGGYVVLRAHDAGRSTEHRRTSSRTHPLLLTDVLTSGMNGIVLAERVRLGWPHTKLFMFMSGVASDNLQTRPWSQAAVNVVVSHLMCRDLARGAVAPSGLATYPARLSERCSRCRLLFLAGACPLVKRRASI